MNPSAPEADHLPTYGLSSRAAVLLDEVVKKIDDKQLTRKIGRTFARISFMMNELAEIDPAARRYMLSLIKEKEVQQIKKAMTEAVPEHHIAWSLLYNVVVTLFRQEFRTANEEQSFNKKLQVERSRQGELSQTEIKSDY